MANEASCACPQDLIRQLLERDPEKRLGAHAGAEEIKAHPFYEEINWVRISTGALSDKGMLQ